MIEKSSEELVADTVIAGFPAAKLDRIETENIVEYRVSVQSKDLLVINSEGVVFNFQTKTKGHIRFSGILEGGPVQVGEMVLRFLADAGYEVYRPSGRRLKKTPIRISRFTFCPGCGSQGTIKKILYGLPEEDFDSEKYVVGGCIVDPNGKDPEISCVECSWSGELEDVRFVTRKGKP